MSHYQLTAPPVQIAHNQTARTAYLIHAGDEHETRVSVFRPNLGELSEITLPHDVQRFAHYESVTALHGTYGASVLSGADVLFTTNAAGPHAFVDGKFKHSSAATDVRGLEFKDGKLGKLELEPHWGTVLAAAPYRGMTLAFFDGTVFSAVGAITTKVDEALRPHILGEIYVHPHAKLISVAHPSGWFYSTDDSMTWQHLDREGWPIKFSDYEIYVVRGLEVVLLA